MLVRWTACEVTEDEIEVEREHGGTASDAFLLLPVSQHG